MKQMYYVKSFFILAFFMATLVGCSSSSTSGLGGQGGGTLSIGAKLEDKAALNVLNGVTMNMIIPDSSGTSPSRLSALRLTDPELDLLTSVTLNGVLYPVSDRQLTYNNGIVYTLINMDDSLTEGSVYFQHFDIGANRFDFISSSRTPYFSAFYLGTQSVHLPVTIPEGGTGTTTYSSGTVHFLNLEGVSFAQLDAVNAEVVYRYTDSSLRTTSLVYPFVLTVSGRSYSGVFQVDDFDTIRLDGYVFSDLFAENGTRKVGQIRINYEGSVVEIWYYDNAGTLAR